ncbi:DUF4158 domain-containing protein [Streptomyces sp. NPDC002082]|uniref:DUF4158 domain-containing protein n=1 Tax=Streptomyces sp. NPDC002082 TaxID=3154772 RepID=UPI00331D62DC
MGRDLGLDGVVDHFTLSGDEVGWLRNKTGATRLGFAVQLKYLTWRGRFPRMRLELPPDAVEHVAKQVGIAASELGFYDFGLRSLHPALPTGMAPRRSPEMWIHLSVEEAYIHCSKYIPHLEPTSRPAGHSTTRPRDPDYFTGPQPSTGITAQRSVRRPV